MGNIYAQGTGGVAKDWVLAGQWVLKAAQRDNHKAQMDYGFMLLAGIGVPENRTEGIQWLAKAAKDPATFKLLQERVALVCASTPGAVEKEPCTRWMKGRKP